MKTIDVYVLEEQYYGRITGVTVDKEEAENWKNGNFWNAYSVQKLTLPQEIQVQRDY